MQRQRRVVVALTVALGAPAADSTPAVATPPDRPELNGTVWVANRLTHTIRAFDGATGSVLRTVDMRSGSQPGDLAYAKGKVYVAEERGLSPGVAVVDASTGEVVQRISIGPRPHHVHASPGGNLIAVGLFGTRKIGIIDARSDTVVGEWETSARPDARSHAGVFGPDGRTVYVANDNVGELSALDARTGLLHWTMAVPNAHELIVSHDEKTAYVSTRSANELHVIDLEKREIERTLVLPQPDTLQLSANEKLLTVGLRTPPARVAVVDTATLAHEVVTIGAGATIAGHQWTSPSGRFTFAAFEGPGQGLEAGVAVIEHGEGNRVVQTLPYAGQPHGVDFARG